jgi:hypothetical protein
VLLAEAESSELPARLAITISDSFCNSEMVLVSAKGVMLSVFLRQEVAMNKMVIS